MSVRGQPVGGSGSGRGSQISGGQSISCLTQVLFTQNDVMQGLHMVVQPMSSGFGIVQPENPLANSVLIAMSGIACGRSRTMGGGACRSRNATRAARPAPFSESVRLPGETRQRA